MTDPDLVYRAEQAYLGAVLARHGQSGSGAGDVSLPPVLRTGDFTVPVHQAIFAAATGQPGSTRPDSPSGWLGRLRDLLERLFSGQARRAAAYMAELPALCPDPVNLPAYAAMIAEACQDRPGQARARETVQAGSEDPILASAGAWLDNTGAARRRQAYPGAAPATGSVPGTQSPAPWRDQAAAVLDPDTTRLARVLRADARKATRPDPAQEHEPGWPADHRAPADPAVRARGQSAPVKPEDLEDRVLASLMKHPDDGRAVIGWLPPEAFSTAARRDLYNLIRQRLASSRPVDPLIIAWDASRLPESHSSREYGGAAFLTQVARWAGSLEPAPGTAEILGKALWAERILTSALGEDWPAKPERARLLAALAAQDPGPQRESAPAATVQAATAGPDNPALHPEAGPAAVTAAQPAPAIIAASATAAGVVRPVPVQPPAPVRYAWPAQPAVPQPAQAQQPPAPAPSGPALRM